MDTTSLEQAIAQAYTYAYPVYAVAHTRGKALRGPHNPQGAAPNTVQHERHLSDHRSRWITAPNNDTLYSNAWLDLSAGPVRLRVGRQPEGRYWSLAFMDAYTNHFAVVGQRLDGVGPVDLVVVAPGQTPPPGADRVVTAPGQDVWVLCRWLVDGPQDLERCHAMQDSLSVQGPNNGVDSGAPSAHTPLDPAVFLDVVNHSMGRNPAPAHHAPLLAAWAPLGLRPGTPGVWSALSPAVQQAWAHATGPAHEAVRTGSAKGRRHMQGWVASAPDMGCFGDNFTLRASVAMGGLAALEPTEAMYFVRFTDDDQAPLLGQHRYRLRVPATDIPTDSFWSFTLYEPTADGQRFFVENPVNRYAIGNRTQGLQRNPDGALDIVVQQAMPSDPQERANWLPCPTGPFQIALRAYLPQAALREGRADMPRLLRA
jgi:hypothetical protein